MRLKEVLMAASAYMGMREMSDEKGQRDRLLLAE
jgi:hypothetical protein